MPGTLPTCISRLPLTAPSRSFSRACRLRRKRWCRHPLRSIAIISCSYCYNLLHLQQISSEIHLIVANLRTDRVGLTGHFGHGQTFASAAPFPEAAMAAICDFAYFVMPMKATSPARSGRGYSSMRRSASETAILGERAGAPIVATLSRYVSGSVERVRGSRYANRLGSRDVQSMEAASS